MSEPAVVIALTRMSVSIPSATPTKACVTSAPMNGAASSDRCGSEMCGATASASAAARPAFTGVGITRVLNGGDTNSHAVARTSARKNAVTTTGSKRMVTSLLEQRRDHVEQAAGEADHLAEHPVSRDDEDERDARELRYERERLLLHLRRRLEQADRETDRE